MLPPLPFSNTSTPSFPHAQKKGCSQTTLRNNQVYKFTKTSPWRLLPWFEGK